MGGGFGEQGQNESDRTISYFKHLRIYFEQERGKKKRDWNFWSSTWVHFFLLLVDVSPFLLNFCFFARKIYIIFQSFFGEVNLKWKQTTHLANPALKLHIKNISSDKYFQGKQTEEKLKNLCGA